jgi:hypothetical protein
VKSEREREKEKTEKVIMAMMMSIILTEKKHSYAERAAFLQHGYQSGTKCIVEWMLTKFIHIG